MRKSYWGVGILVFWLLGVVQVKADVIWEPYGNDFYMEHSTECEYVNRSYTTNGPTGSVIVYVSPENAEQVLTLENGMKVQVSFTYTDSDGIVWGVYENFETDETGWLPMDYMEVVYDYISFEEEFGTEITATEGTLSEECRGTTVYFYNYPGAETCIEFSVQEDQENLPIYRSLFVDEEGRSWGYFGYYYGVKNKWICLDNPSATFEELYPNGAPARGSQEVPADSAASDRDASGQQVGDGAASHDIVEKDMELITPKQDNSLVGFVGAIVVAVVGVTGALLAWLKRSAKK